MTFLAKIGQLILKGLGVVSVLAETGVAKIPGLGTVQVVSRDLAEMAKIVTAIEVAVQAGHLTLDQALQVEAAQIQQVVLASALVAGKQIADPAELQLACEGFANAIVHLYKAIHPDAVKVVAPQDLS